MIELLTIFLAGVVLYGIFFNKSQIKQAESPQASEPASLSDQEILNKKCHDYLTGNHW